MCGIFATTDTSLLANQRPIERCLERRGTEKPIWRTTASGMVLAHCLLPVRGEAPVLQPIETDQGFLVYSGELWDVEPGLSDTVALAERLERFGLRRTIATIQGMWALVLISQHHRKIAFCTDVLGEQPLHYAVIGNHISVATEVKTLVAAGIPLAGIYHVRPGQLYVFDGTLKATPYARATSRNRWKSVDNEVLRSRIARAVQSHIGSVDLQAAGILLSGGIDSTIMAWHASQLGIKKAWTVAVHRQAPDVVAAEQVASRLGLDWEYICCDPHPIEFGVVAAEVVNRSILEETSLHITLARHLSQRGVRVVLTGSGADELFIGYAHLFRRVPRHLLQQRFLDGYYKLDLRAMNKVYGGFAVEIRNPFLHPSVVSYALQLHTDILIGPKMTLKWPLRRAYADILDGQSTAPKRIARETMGAKAWFANRHADGGRVFHPLWKEIMGDSQRTMEILSIIDRQ